MLQVDAFATALAAFLTELLTFIPKIVGFIIVLIIGYFIGKGVARGMGVLLGRIHLDVHLSGTRIGEYSERTGSSFSNLIVGISKWLVYIAFILFAIDVLDIGPLTVITNGILAWIPNLVATLLIVFVGAIVASYIGKWLENSLPRWGVTGGKLIAVLVEVILYIIIFTYALIQIGFGQGIIFMVVTALSWGIAAAIAIAIGIPLAFALREVFTPMLTGALNMSSTLKPGQSIEIHDIQLGEGQPKTLRGEVTDVGLFSMIVKNRENGGFVVLPNSVVMGKPIMIQGGPEPELVEKRAVTRISQVTGSVEGQGASPPVRRAAS
jgi:hypothetical protein